MAVLSLLPRADPYPRFSDAEIERRRAMLARAMAARGATHAVLYGANRSGSAIPWLTRWPVTREAVCVFTPGERDLLLVDFYNHVPNATRIATEADVRWTGPNAIETAISELRRRGAAGRPVAVIGALPHAAHLALGDVAGRVVEMSKDYLSLRHVKSAEEISWLRVGCELTDRAVNALAAELRPGLSEHQLADICERAYVPAGGRTHIHYMGVTPMAEPGLSVPAQWTSARRVEPGDAVSCEISASFWDYAGQVLRTFAVAAEPTPLYLELHEVAVAAFDAIVDRLHPGATAAELVAASAVIEEAGYTTRDDLVHGFVGGYLPPVLGSPSRQLTPVPDFTLEAGMTLVVQPNVITRDETAGVQTGELVLVTDLGPQRLHAVAGGLRRVA
ncbi:MAG TPA: M24 family metallopeptidase [Solirubrobacterales bacterium]|nr:M24 family metallopeptidase [Solirubrobacterales bacterium]